MTRPEVLAVTRLSPFYMEALQRAFTVHQQVHESDPAAFAALAPRIQAIAAAGDSRVGADLIRSLPALKIISVMGVGYDGVDVAEARRRGVVVTHTPGVLDDDVADLALGLMLCVARALPQADAYVRRGEWLRGPMPLQRKLSGSRLGIVGMGRIGQAIATRAQAFRMSISYTARNARPHLPYRHEPDLRRLAEQSDFLVVITPGGAATRGLIDASVLRALGPEGYLINVARGSVVDQQALVEALASGTIAGAGLDVFANEPEVPAALLAHPNVVVTPHIGSATSQTRQAMADLAFRNLEACFDDGSVLTPVPECSESL